MKFKPWFKLFVGIFGILIFLFVLGPIYMKLPWVKPIFDLVKREEIKVNAFFYTDFDDYAVLYNEVDDRIKYSHEDK